MNLEKLLPKFNTIYIHCNEHNDYYETLEQFFQRPIFEDISEIWKKECIQENKCWEIQLYPITPIGFYFVIATTLEKCIERIHQAVNEENIKEDLLV
jgi:hypothetical protein